VVIVKFRIHPNSIFPTEWRKYPDYAQITGQNMLGKNEIWLRHGHATRPDPELDKIAVDYPFIREVFNQGDDYTVYWWDRLVGGFQNGRGWGITEY
jgi:hypothetical protein